jgi:hypothetical protein
MVSAKRPALKVVTPGIARLATLFTAGVRHRAGAYLGGDKIRITSNDELAVSAVVWGAAEYRVKLEHTDDRILYGCTCPYFRNGGAACKHLWALVLEANVPVVRAAATCSHFEPLTTAPFRIVNPLSPVDANAGSARSTRNESPLDEKGATALEQVLEAQLEALRQRPFGNEGRLSNGRAARLKRP